MDWLDLLAVQGTLQESSPTPQLPIRKSMDLASTEQVGGYRNGKRGELV